MRTFRASAKKHGILYVSRKAHVQLVHMEGYVKCSFGNCNLVLRPAGMESHMEQMHQETTCEHCGKKMSGVTKLEQHIRMRHPEMVNTKQLIQ